MQFDIINDSIRLIIEAHQVVLHVLHDIQQHENDLQVHQLVCLQHVQQVDDVQKLIIEEHVLHIEMQLVVLLIVKYILQHVINDNGNERYEMQHVLVMQHVHLLHYYHHVLVHVIVRQQLVIHKVLVLIIEVNIL